MEFADILEQTIALLQHQGRISYGVLKRRFGLDDAYLEDLKIELIEAQQLAGRHGGGEVRDQPRRMIADMMERAFHARTDADANLGACKKGGE